VVTVTLIMSLLGRAFGMGFSESEEGYNGEYMSISDNERLKAARNECVAHLMRELGQPSSAWVAVESDAKPGHGDTVWVYAGTDVFLGEYWGESGFQSYGASCDIEGLNSQRLFDVTHWMEIGSPEPPFSDFGKHGDAGK